MTRRVTSMPIRNVRPLRTGRWLVAACVTVLAGCASGPPVPEPPSLTPTQARAMIVQALPASAPDRTKWATDIHAAFAALEIETSPTHVCSVIAVTEQESSFRADPIVPNLAAITWKEIDQRAERAGVPRLVVHAALRLSSPDGKTYSERIDAARTERELNAIFEDFIGMVPMGQRLFGGYNPVRTGGPMQVSIAFAQAHAQANPYPYAVEGSIRREVFTRRGGMYFGIAHLLGYPASYDRPLYRFADFNAGRYASRNAAFQNAVSIASGIPLALDGDLLREATEEHPGPGETERATRVLGKRLDMSESAIHRALEQGADESFERTTLYERVFALADATERRSVPRAMVPRIALKSPKITRKLTTAWFANRVDERHRRCMSRLAAGRDDAA